MKIPSIRKIILKVPYFPQQKRHYTCGPVCIRMVLSYLRKRRLTENEYDEILDLTINGNPKLKRGTTKQKMKLAIKKLGFKYNNTYGENGLVKALQKERPVIAKCLMYDEYGDPYQHYIVITGQDDEYFFINDPYAGKPGRIQKDIFMARGQKLNWGYNKCGIEVYED